jgi:hypothetical protein
MALRDGARRSDVNLGIEAAAPAPTLEVLLCSVERCARRTTAKRGRRL